MTMVITIFLNLNFRSVVDHGGSAGFITGNGNTTDIFLDFRRKTAQSAHDSHQNPETNMATGPSHQNLFHDSISSDKSYWTTWNSPADHDSELDRPKFETQPRSCS